MTDRQPAMRLQRGPRLLARSLPLIVLGLASAAWAGGALAESYLILAIIGDRLTVVAPENKVGSNMDRNRYQVLPLADRDFDIYALQLAQTGIQKARPAATVSLLRVNDPKLYALRSSWQDTDAVDARELLSLAGDMAASAPDAHLLLIAPYETQPEVQTDRETRGSGKAGGLGFYLDGTSRMWDLDKNGKGSGEIGKGFLGVFANLQLILINLESRTIEGKERIVVGTTFAASRAPDKTPWNALSGAEKIATLKSLMKTGIDGSMPKLLAPRQP